MSKPERPRLPATVVALGFVSLLTDASSEMIVPLLHVFAVRITDRIGKGIRTAPRDALIADAAPEGRAGAAFGLQRSMDHAGAIIGPLAAAGAIAIGVSVRGVFWLAAIPAALALVAF